MLHMNEFSNGFFDFFRNVTLPVPSPRLIDSSCLTFFPPVALKHPSRSPLIFHEPYRIGTICFYSVSGLSASTAYWFQCHMCQMLISSGQIPTFDAQQAFVWNWLHSDWISESTNRRGFFFFFFRPRNADRDKWDCTKVRKRRKIVHLESHLLHLSLMETLSREGWNTWIWIVAYNRGH